MEIEKGLPMPKGSIMVATMRKLEVGDSFIYDVDKRTQCHLTATRIGIKVSCRSLGDGKIRVWRVS